MIWTVENFSELVRVNRRVNKDLQYLTDLQHYQQTEYWASAKETTKDMKADCEDYAIMKMAMLRALFWPKEDLNLAVCMVQGKGHCVLVVTTDKEDYVLDNNTDEVLHWSHARFLWVGVTVKGNFKDWRAIVT